jgi:hypothetical protein
MIGYQALPLLHRYTAMLFCGLAYLRQSNHLLTQIRIAMAILHICARCEIKLFENKYQYNEMLIKKTLHCVLIANIILYPSLAKYMWRIYQTGR